jgi:hypothetical protein
MTKIPGSPHKLPGDFKEWLPSFSGDDFVTIEDHLDTFLYTLEPYDQHEDVQMRLFSYTLVERDKEWYDSIFRDDHKLGSFSRTFCQKIQEKKILSVPL